MRGRVPEGRRRIARALTPKALQSTPEDIHGLLVAADGWGLLLQHDSAAGIARLRSGLDLEAAPGTWEKPPIFAINLRSRLRPERLPATRDSRFSYGFDFNRSIGRSPGWRWGTPTKPRDSGTRRFRTTNASSSSGTRRSLIYTEGRTRPPPRCRRSAAIDPDHFSLSGRSSMTLVPALHPLLSA